MIWCFFCLNSIPQTGCCDGSLSESSRLPVDLCAVVPEVSYILALFIDPVQLWLCFPQCFSIDWLYGVVDANSETIATVGFFVCNFHWPDLKF